MAARNGAAVCCEHCERLDEAQLEVSRKLVSFKMFETKEECQAFKDEQLELTGKVWSDISHSPKGGYFVAYCRAGELTGLAVQQAGEFYKTELEGCGPVSPVNLNLTAGYIIGRNWSETH